MEKQEQKTSSKVIYNIFRGSFIGATYFSKTERAALEELIHFKYKNYNAIPLSIRFPTEVKLNMTFKSLNWFTYKHSDYLSFDILRVREYETNKTYYFQFVKHNYKIYPTSFVKEKTELSRLYDCATDFNSDKDSLYDIFKLELKDGKELGVQHYKRYTGKNEFFRAGDDLLNGLNEVPIKDFVIFKTGFNQSRLMTDSPLENSFRDSRFLFVLYNINPSGSYQLTDFPVRQSQKYENVYFVETQHMKHMFTQPEILSSDVDRYWISFDIESECVPEREIWDERNIMTHLGFEYFCDNYYTKFKSHDKSFNFCFINLDFYLRQQLYKRYPSLKTLIQKDELYEQLRYDLVLSDALNEAKENEINALKEKPDCLVYENYMDVLDEVKKSKVKYLFCKEVNIVLLFKELLTRLRDVDSIGTFNGHSYDFTHLSRRYCYLVGKQIGRDQLTYNSLYSEEKPMFYASQNLTTNFKIINMELNQPYYSIDLFNYALKFKPELDSFSLKEVAKLTYNLKSIVRPSTNLSHHEVYIINIFRHFKDTVKSITDDNEKRRNELKKREEEYTKSLFKFIQVLLSSNYVYINDIAFKIIDKTKFIPLNSPLYEIDINSVLNSTKTIKGVEVLESEIMIQAIEGRVYQLRKDFTWDNYHDFIYHIALAKDDIEIGDKKIFEKQSTFEIANYCIHDALLCRYLMRDLSIKENIDVFSQIYFLPQSQAFLFRNSTNFLGYLLKTCFEEKSFLKKSNKITTENYSGGKVFDPREHFLKEPVIMLDFESLYPSIMINCNISPDTLVLVLDLKCMLEVEIVKVNIERIFDPQYYSIVYNIRDPVFNILVFTKINEKGEPRKGLLSYMLSDLKVKRKLYKNKMKAFYEEGNMFQYVNCNMIQNCIKVLMNAVYGLLGSNFHNIACKFTSQAVTAIGVRSISFLADYFDRAIIKDNKIYIQSELCYNPICSKPIEAKRVFDFETEIKDEIELKLVYGDTDSIMIIPKGINKLKELNNQPDQIYKRRAYYYVSMIGNTLSNLINKVILESNLNLEFESIYFDMIIMAKKKYKSLKVDPINKTGLTITDIDNLEPDLKSDNKGISLKRRDNCLFHKNCIIQLYKILHEKINGMRFKEEDIDYQTIGEEVVSFMRRIRLKLLHDILFDQIKMNDFILSSAYKGNYKNLNYPTLVLVKEYNKTARDPITEGERFKFLFLKRFKPTYTLSQIANLEEDERLRILLTTIDWGFIDKDINAHKMICDETTNLRFENGERIFLEIYLSKLRKDIKTIFVTNEEIYKILNKEEQLFLSYNS